MREQYTTIDGVIINDAEFQTRAARWANYSRTRFMNNIKNKMSAKQSGVLLKSVKYSFLKRGGMIERASFSFHQYGIDMAYGVGKGYIHTSFGVVRGMRTDRHRKTKGKKDKGLFSLVGGSAINRKAVDWFDAELPSMVSKFADLISEYYGDKFLINEDTVTRLKIAK
ncbi:MAG: hypothetical protein ACOYOV_02830 [Bacteroidales bacterium]